MSALLSQKRRPPSNVLDESYQSGSGFFCLFVCFPGQKMEQGEKISVPDNQQVAVKSLSCTLKVKVGLNTE